MSKTATGNGRDLDLVRLGNAVREARKRAGLRQKDLAARIHRDGTWVSHVEHGRRRPSTEMLVCIADSLEALPEELLAAAGRIHPETQEALLALTPAQAVQLRRVLRERLKERTP